MWGIVRKRAAENRPLWPNAVPLRLRRKQNCCYYFFSNFTFDEMLRRDVMLEIREALGRDVIKESKKNLLCIFNNLFLINFKKLNQKQNSCFLVFNLV